MIADPCYRGSRVHDPQAWDDTPRSEPQHGEGHSEPKRGRKSSHRHFQVGSNHRGQGEGHFHFLHLPKRLVSELPILGRHCLRAPSMQRKPAPAIRILWVYFPPTILTRHTGHQDHRLRDPRSQGRTTRFPLLGLWQRLRRR